MEEDEGNQIIRLRSSDDQVFEVTERAAKISELVEDSPREEDEVTEIEIARVRSPCLSKVVEFMKHYDEEKMKEIPTPLGGATFNEVSNSRWMKWCLGRIKCSGWMTTVFLTFDYDLLFVSG